jgi:predicted RNA-binding Zn-ribbon protein involved in translation (DUF1610 family)
VTDPVRVRNLNHKQSRASLRVPIGAKYTTFESVAFAIQAVAVIGMIGILVDFAVSPHRKLPAVYVLPPTILFVLSDPLREFARRRASAGILKEKLRRCVHCRYALSGLSEEGTCPECGAEYSEKSLREGWCAQYPSLVPDLGLAGRPRRLEPYDPIRSAMPLFLLLAAMKSSAPLAWILVSASMSALVVSLWVWLERRRGVAEVVRAKYRLCLTCRSRLDGPGDRPKCPNCGTTFTLEQLVAAWGATYPWPSPLSGVRPSDD